MSDNRRRYVNQGDRDNYLKGYQPVAQGPRTSPPQDGVATDAAPVSTGEDSSSAANSPSGANGDGPSN